MGFDLGGNHPLHPLRWELTWLLAQTLCVVDDFDILEPEPADVDTLGLVHTLGYIDAVRRASRPGCRFSVGHGLGTADNPIFPGMHQNAALIAGGSVAAGRAIAHREVDRAVNFCGGLHHAMADSASGFCVYNDAALGIAALLEAGVRKVAYVDVDAHHGDGVQAAFYDDPRVLTVSVHQSPLTLFPGTGWASECGPPPGPRLPCPSTCPTAHRIRCPSRRGTGELRWPSTVPFSKPARRSTHYMGWTPTILVTRSAPPWARRAPRAALHEIGQPDALSVENTRVGIGLPTLARVFPTKRSWSRQPGV